MTPSFKHTLHTGALVVSLALGASLPTRSHALDLASPDHVAFKTASIDGIDIAYREAGDPSHPTVLLLHGFPTSSHMFRNLIPELAQEYHVIAPDYPGFGASAMPPAAEFEYSFANIAGMMTALLDQKGVEGYVAYVMDYGAPVGYRMFADDPERVDGFVIQNGNAYAEGLREFWDPIKAYWAAPTVENGDALRGFFALEATKWQFTAGVQNPENISPDNYWTVQYLLDRPGNQEVQLDLFLDYGTNVGEYPKWQALFREHQPPALLMWGKNDPIFPEEGAHPYKADLKDLEFHILDTGHFALEEFGPEMAVEMLEFLDRVYD
jgi:pimeloyl-ACP methyl ester carboxylesterase